MNLTAILNYLADLERNNEREWYHAHKNEYKAANGEFEQLIKRLIIEIGKTDGSILMNDPRDLTFKLNRDTRFSNDKSPYNPAFRAHISSAGKLPIPVGYYLYIRPGDRSFLGGGLFAAMFKEATSMIREYLAAHGEEFEAVISSERFTKYFTVKGEALKNVPKGYDPAHPQAQYLKFKSMYIEYTVQDGLFDDAEQFVALATDVFTAMQPFNAYLNTALKDFQMPQR